MGQTLTNTVNAGGLVQTTSKQYGPASVAPRKWNLPLATRCLRRLEAFATPLTRLRSFSACEASTLRG